MVLVVQEDNKSSKTFNYIKLVEQFGSIRNAARAMGLPRSTFFDRYKAQRNNEAKPVSEPFVYKELLVWRKPKEGTIARYICTSAQNNTPVHPEFWRNLKAYAEYTNAKILVSRFMYYKGFGTPGKAGTNGSDSGVWYDNEINDYVADSQVLLSTDGLVWCGEMNILPTAVRPLSGLETYTGKRSAIFPHVKMAMESIPNSKHLTTKFNYTTGTVTQSNYIQKKAGLKAEHHHTYGALMVEVDS